MSSLDLKEDGESPWIVCTSKTKTECDLLRIVTKALKWKHPGFQQFAKDSNLVFFGPPYSNRLKTDETYQSLGSLQCVNRISGVNECCKKSRQEQDMEHLLRLVNPKQPAFVPLTWRLPEQYHDLRKYISKTEERDDGAERKDGAETKDGVETKTLQKNNFLILKPSEGSCGQGIRLFSQNLHSVQQVMENVVRKNPLSKFVIQEYIDPPVCLQGFKFDFRIYLVIISVKPFIILLYREGLARFCTKLYTSPKRDIDSDLNNTIDQFAHLSNYSINKDNAEEKGQSHATIFGQESIETLLEMKSSDKSIVNKHAVKQCLTNVLRQIEEEYSIDSTKLWEKIGDIACKCALAMMPTLQLRGLEKTQSSNKNVPKGGEASNTSNTGDPSAFHIIGMDIILQKSKDEDAQLQPYLLELNASPSLNIKTAGNQVSRVDAYVKGRLLCDTFRVARFWHERQRQQNTVDDIFKLATALNFVPLLRPPTWTQQGSKNNIINHHLDMKISNLDLNQNIYFIWSMIQKIIKEKGVRQKQQDGCTFVMLKSYDLIAMVTSLPYDAAKASKLPYERLHTCKFGTLGAMKSTLRKYIQHYGQSCKPFDGLEARHIIDCFYRLANIWIPENHAEYTPLENYQLSHLGMRLWYFLVLVVNQM
eukprot:g1789.t1